MVWVKRDFLKERSTFTAKAFILLSIMYDQSMLDRSSHSGHQEMSRPINATSSPKLSCFCQAWLSRMIQLKAVSSGWS